MARKAYLTIDDSPSDRMDDLAARLFQKSIPAIFYCRGDMLERNLGSAARAAAKGFVLANHTYSHRRSSEEDTDWIIADIERCERLIERAYQSAGVRQGGKYFRFPHMDRGTGGWIVDYDSYPPEERAALLEIFAGGLNIASLEKPAAAALEKKEKLQAYLKAEGYSQPFRNVTAPWYGRGEIAQARDSFYTFSNCDWMVTERHRGKWPYKTAEDLKNRARSDASLSAGDGVNVILAHDQAEIVDITMELIEDLAENGMEFLTV
ncbi:MAG: polysaccharide deacetylase family protein [Micavibrio sp.]